MYALLALKNLDRNLFDAEPMREPSGHRPQVPKGGAQGNWMLFKDSLPSHWQLIKIRVKLIEYNFLNYFTNKDSELCKQNKLA